ncbi:acyl-CoA thioesterase [Marinoscillum furvescens]|uniref:Acyl-CoA thioester hydrolase n=1 Tax=Marinoscillum furvescens DSM 4134 TaxID=1122208 RepID=A0A3D9LIQ5_MARFU|nr:acyl-CoA thioesterase [Marinoscillum furvescens]REE05745.1 acyl-CoA thioester hydrolase [Marinoscillum furvescens DSM 4134]
MEPYKQHFQVIWADLDPNAHMRHTAYNDYAAQVRVGLFDELGLPLKDLVASGYGPVLFHEDTTFKREVFMNEHITVDCAALSFRKDLKVWKFRQQIWKADESLACTVIATGAFMSLKERKVVVPPQQIIDMLERIPKTGDFHWLEK